MGVAWGLEVVRGREVGRVYPVGPGRLALGNALNGEPGLDLSTQEGPAPRRMAARQALLECSTAGLTLRDLDSPGGTFVNRQRILPEQTRGLQPGDVVQLGAVQLRVVAGTPAPPTTPVPTAAPPPAQATAGPGRGPGAPFALTSGGVCRTWDDFLTASAQNWRALRGDLESGRLDEYLTSIGRADLRPPGATSGDPDDRLDAWLGRLPTTRAAQADLEVHPSVVRVRAQPGGGTTRGKVVVTSTGYRLLRSTVRVEPPATSWLAVVKPFDGGPFATAETTEVPLEIRVPEGLVAPRVGVLTVESNGGTRTVEVRVEPVAAAEPPPDPSEPSAAGSSRTLDERLRATPPGLRLVLAVAAAVLLRLVVWAGDRVAGLWAEAGEGTTALGGVAVLGAVAGGIGGFSLVRRRGDAADLFPGAFTGAVAGVLTAAVAAAIRRSVEPPGGWNLVTAVGVWAALAGLAAVGSLAAVPVDPQREHGGGP